MQIPTSVCLGQVSEENWGVNSLRLWCWWWCWGGVWGTPPLCKVIYKKGGVQIMVWIVTLMAFIIHFLCLRLVENIKTFDLAFNDTLLMQSIVWILVIMLLFTFFACAAAVVVYMFQYSGKSPQHHWLWHHINIIHIPANKMYNKTILYKMIESMCEFMVCLTCYDIWTYIETQFIVWQSNYIE